MVNILNIIKIAILISLPDNTPRYMEICSYMRSLFLYVENCSNFSHKD